MKVIIFPFIFIPNCLAYFLLAKNVSPSTSSQTKIANGINASPGEFPYIVSIKNLDLNSHACSGVIIDPFWVLSTRGCVSGLKERFQVYLNTDNRLLTGPKMDIELINTTRNDIRDIFVDNIALIRLTTAINTTGIHAAKLVNDNTKLWPNMPLVMAGWGHTEKCIQRLSKRLKKSSTILQPEQVCKKMSKHFNKSHLCSGDANTNACMGDSGGPLLIKGANSKEDIVIGIASYGRGGKCSRQQWPSVWVNLQHYLGWIKSIMRKYKKEYY